MAAAAKPKKGRNLREKTVWHKRASLWIAVGLMAALSGFLFLKAAPKTSAPTPEKDQTQIQARLLGRWLRPDGGYTLDVRAIGDDGQAAVAYFNPNPIHVARSMVLSQGARVGLFVELQDRGYPGATYELGYDPERDMLTGIYHQPAVGGSFDVIFIRTE